MPKSPFHTDANYKRLVDLIKPMETVEEFFSAFPECVDPQVSDLYPLDRVWEEVEDMQAIPKDTSDGILAHVCAVCGGMKFGVRPVWKANFVRLCPVCHDTVAALYEPDTNWNGLTMRGQDAVLGILKREFRIPGTSEVQRFERKRRPRQPAG